MKRTPYLILLSALLLFSFLTSSCTSPAPLVQSTATLLPATNTPQPSTPTPEPTLTNTPAPTLTPTLVPLAIPTSILRTEQWNGVFTHTDANSSKQKFSLYMDEMNGLTFTGKMVWQPYGNRGNRAQKGATVRIVGEFVTDFGDGLEQLKWENLRDYRREDRSGYWVKWQEVQIIQGYRQYSESAWYYAHLRESGNMVAVFFFNENETIAHIHEITLSKVR